MEARLAAGLYRINADPNTGMDGADMPLLIGTFAEFDPDDIDDIVWALVEDGVLLHDGNGVFHAAPYLDVNDN